MEPTTIGQYRVTGVIGQGGMGTVYAGEHTLLGRPAAIKVLLPEYSQKQDIVQRFFNEARAATAIRHLGIIEIYDFGWTPDGAAFIVMERLEGETLARRSSRQRFHWQAAFAIARQIAGALAAAHAKAIVHRDLKPDNIFVIPDSEVPGGERIKLLDFGIAKLAGDGSSTASVTRTGALMGTPTYMAPEQCRGVAVDHRADIYALGCIAFELCTGRPPFVGEGAGDVLAAHIHMPVPQLSAFGVPVPYPVELLLQRLLAKNPAERVQTAEQLIREIDAVAAERQPAVAASLTGPSPVIASPSMTTLSGSASMTQPGPAGRSRGQWKSIALISSVAAVVTIVVVAVAMRGGGDPKDLAAAASSAPVSSGEAPASPPLAPQPTAPPVAKVAPPAPAASSSASSALPADSAAPPAPTEPVKAGAATAATAPPKHDGSAVPSASNMPASPSSPRSSRDQEGPFGTPEPVVDQEGPFGTPRPVAIDGVNVSIDSVPSGAEVFLGGKPVGKTPYHGTLPRQDRDVVVVLRRSGYLDGHVVIHTDHAISERIPLQSNREHDRDRNRSVNPFN